MADYGSLFGMFAIGVIFGIFVLALVFPFGCHIMHVRLRTRRYDFELVTGYGLSPGARVRFGEAIQERRAEALPIEPSPPPTEEP